MTSRFGTLLFRQAVRPWLRHPLLPALNILSIAAGVAVFLAIQIANRGALASFQNAVGLVAGRAHLEIRGNLPDDLFPAVAAAEGVRSATPLVEGIVTLPDSPGEYLRILGVDPFTGSGLRVFHLEAGDGTPLDLEAWLRGPAVIAVSAEARLPASLRALAAGRQVELTPRFVLKSDDAVVRSDPRLAAMDIGWAQELLNLRGRLTSIQVELEKPLESAAAAVALRKLAPPDATVGPPARRNSDTEAMLGAFQLNLTALSLVSIIVGMFLIYNSLSASVVRRRAEIGILRANGATKAEVGGLFLGEALVGGILGTLLGLAASGPLAHLLSAPLEKTVSSLYALVTIDRLAITPLQVAAAFAVGVGASLAAAWRPAAEAAGCDPAAILHPGSAMEAFRSRSRKWGLLGSAFLALAGALSWGSLAGGGKFLGFASVGCLIAGFSLLVPSLVRGFGGLVRGPGWLVRLAAQHLVRSLHRNAVTIAALAVAAAMTVSVSVMIFSFRASVATWMGSTLVADLFIAPAANEIAGLQSFVPEEAVEWARKNPLVREAGTFREQQVDWDGRTVSLGVIEGGARGELEFVGGPKDAGRLFREPGHIAVSESFATKFRVRPGDRIVLASPSGPAGFLVAGVIKDFTRDSGLVLIRREEFRKFWSDERVHSLALLLRDPAAAGAVADAFRQKFGSRGEFSIYTNSALRGRVMEIFDQTFAVTYVLRSIAVLVAVAGVLLSLTTLVVERGREIGVLRSLGASAGQIRALILTEAGMIGLLSSLVGVACGSAMAMVLTWVVNKAFFGWTIELRYPLDVLAGTPLWIIPAAILAAWVPAVLASRIPPARAVRFE